MPIEFRCTACQKLLRVPDGSAGKKAKCPDCEAVLLIPAISPPPVPGSPPPRPDDDGTSPFAGAGQAPPPPVSDNPFASPSASSRLNPAMRSASDDKALSIVPTQIEVGDVMGEAFRIFKSDMGLLIGANIFVGFITNVLNQVAQLSAGPLVDNLKEVGVVVVVLIYCFSYGVNFFLGIGQTALILNIASGRTAKFSDIFSGGPYVLRVLGASIVFSLIFGGGLLLLIVPGVIFALMFGQFYNLIVDRNVGAMESLTISREITTGNKGTLFLLGLISIGVSFLGILACIIGLLFAAAYLQIMGAVAYRRMAGLPIKQEGSFTGSVA